VVERRVEAADVAVVAADARAAEERGPGGVRGVGLARERRGGVAQADGDDERPVAAPEREAPERRRELGQRRRRRERRVEKVAWSAAQWCVCLEDRVAASVAPLTAAEASRTASRGDAASR